jgi:hypothetical protein
MRWHERHTVLYLLFFGQVASLSENRGCHTFIPVATILVVVTEASSLKARQYELLVCQRRHVC